MPVNMLSAFRKNYRYYQTILCQNYLATALALRMIHQLSIIPFNAHGYNVNMRTVVWKCYMLIVIIVSKPIYV